MPDILIIFVAEMSTVALVGMWFRVVQGELARRRNNVESARKQVIASQKRWEETEGKERSGAKAVHKRSEEERQERVREYNKALKKARNKIPGSVMGYRKMREIKEIGKGESKQKGIKEKRH